MTTKSQKAADKAEAKTALLAILKPGDTVYTVLRNVSRSGMSRHIDLYKLEDGEPRWLSSLAGRLLDYRQAPHGNGLVVGGCGMDMGFHVVYSLSSALWKDGHTCTGENCPSNDHSNGDRDHTPHAHRDAGYALRQRWL